MKTETNCMVVSKYKSTDDTAIKNTLKRKLAELINQQIIKTGQKE